MNRFVLFLSLLVVFILTQQLRIYWFQQTWRKGGNVSLSLRLFEKPYQSRSTCRADLGPFRVLFDQKWVRCESLKPGVVVHLHGKPSTTRSNVTNKNNTKKTLIAQEDTYIEEDAVSGIYSIIQIPSLLEEIRQFCFDSYSGLLPTAHASLAMGMVFGGTDAIPMSLYTTMQIAGLLHMLSASGYNVSLVSGYAKKVGSITRIASAKVMLSSFVVFLYCALAGMSLPVLRAGVAELYKMICLMCGRRYHQGWSLIFTTCIFLLINPFLFYSFSFQLSVAAVAGLTWIAPMIEEVFQRWIPWLYRGIRQNLAVSIAANLVTMPILATHFQEYSVISPLANVFCAWLVPYIMFGAVGVLVSHVLVPFLDRAMVFMVYGPAELFIRIASFFSAVPFAQVRLEFGYAALFLWVSVVYSLYFLRRKWVKNDRFLKEKVFL